MVLCGIFVVACGSLVGARGLRSCGSGSLVAVQAQELQCGLRSCGAGSLVAASGDSSLVVASGLLIAVTSLVFAPGP